MKIDLKPFYDLVDQKYLSVQKHPTEDLLIWNYTQKCQFDRKWTTETMMARGLVTDLVGNLVARPFKKFFNFEEHTGEDSKLSKLPMNEAFEVFDKVDGSLGILYFLPDGTPQIATRGSFVSEQAIEANKILSQMISEKNIKFDPKMGYTWLFEIIYPENRIVVDYGDARTLVQLAVINIETGDELPIKTLLTPFTKVQSYDGLTDFDSIKKFVRNNAEGFVIRFQSGVRCKLKYEEYVRLHRLVTGVNAKTIWDLLRHNESLNELLEKVPEEFYDWVVKTKKDLEEEYNLAEAVAWRDYEAVKDLKTRKVQAKKIFKIDSTREKKLSGIIFKMLDKQPYEEMIWRMLKPRADKPWKEDIDA